MCLPVLITRIKTNKMADPDEVFIAESEDKIKEIVQKLGWDLKTFTENFVSKGYLRILFEIYFIKLSNYKDIGVLLGTCRLC